MSVLITVFCILQSAGAVKAQRVEYQLTPFEASNIASQLGLKSYQAASFQAKACQNIQMIFDETASDPSWGE